MKRLRSKGIGSMKRQAEAITIEEEELLREKVYLVIQILALCLILWSFTMVSILPSEVEKNIASYIYLHARLRLSKKKGRDPTYNTQKMPPRTDPED